MNYFKRVKKLGSNMTICDFAYLKFSVLFGTLFLVGIWEWFRNLVLSINPWIYLFIMVLFSIPLLKKMFKD